MRIFGFSIAILAVIGLASFLVSSRNQSAADSASIVDATNELLKEFPEELRKRAQLGYDAPERTVWNFVPLPDRHGVPLREMSEAQQKRTLALVQKVLSQIGYEKTTQIMSLENILRKAEGPASIERRDPIKYYITVFGTPSADSTWGLSYEGHHLSLNFVLEGNKIIESTPQFMATNPAELREDFGPKFPKGLRVLADEETLAFELVQSLDAGQRQKAVIAKEAIAEIRGPNKAQPEQESAAGIEARELSKSQQALLKQILESYTRKMTDEVAAERWSLIEKSDFQTIKFAWAGADKPGIGHYYRIQGSTFLVEFVNTQPDAFGNVANHIHCVWRDMTGDFNLKP